MVDEPGIVGGRQLEPADLNRRSRLLIGAHGAEGYRSDPAMQFIVLTEAIVF